MLNQQLGFRGGGMGVERWPKKQEKGAVTASRPGKMERVDEAGQAGAAGRRVTVRRPHLGTGGQYQAGQGRGG